MLPSGNDSAFVLSQHFGKMLYEKKYIHWEEKTDQKVYSWQFGNF
jgi:hypothetical protein